MLAHTIFLIALTLTVVTARYDRFRSAINPHIQQLTAVTDRIAEPFESAAVQTQTSIMRSGQMVVRSFTRQYDGTRATLAGIFGRPSYGIRTDVGAMSIACAVSVQAGDGTGETTIVAAISVETSDTSLTSASGFSAITSAVRGAVNRLVRPIVRLGRGLGTVMLGVFGGHESSADREYGGTSNVSTIGG